MPNYAIFVGNYCSFDRLSIFITSIYKTKSIDMSNMYIINTSIAEDKLNSLASAFKTNIISLGIQRAVAPAEQMQYRIDAMRDVCYDDTIICNFDDDYQFNPYWLEFALRVMNVEQIKYLTLLKTIPGCGMTHGDHIGEIIKLSGFNFAKTKSAMGGSFITKWGHFREHMSIFFKTYNIGGQYDGDFWNVVNTIYGGNRNVYMTMDFSLYQHCNLGSQYGHDIPHTYGSDYDPILNPFTIAIA